MDDPSVRMGVDEFGTGSKHCEGWTCFCLQETSVNDFVRNSKEILDKTKLNAFHGKDYKRKYRSEYRDFLQLIREFASRSNLCFAVNSLLSEDFKREFISFGQRTLEGALKGAGMYDETSRRIMSSYIAPLYTLARMSNRLNNNVTATIEMDKHSSFGDLNSIVSQGKHSPIPAHAILIAIYNGYAKMYFHQAPLLQNNGISVMDDSDSFLIQAADIMGSYSMAYARKKLGITSATNDAKSDIIEEVYGDTIEGFDFSSSLVLQGNIFLLKKDDAGSFDFEVH